MCKFVCYMCEDKLAYEYMYLMNVVPMEARGYRIVWTWSCRPFLATLRSFAGTSALDHLTTSPAALVILLLVVQAFISNTCLSGNPLLPLPVYESIFYYCLTFCSNIPSATVHTTVPDSGARSTNCLMLAKDMLTPSELG